MHSLGFYHEHQRPDRDSFVTVQTSEMMKECLSQFERMKDDPYKHFSKGKRPTI